MNLKMKAAFVPNLRLALSITAAAAALLVFGSARSQTAQAHTQPERKITMISQTARAIFIGRPDSIRRRLTCFRTTNL
jgi:hypothetical protein